ncbi:MAG: tetratricopeptide repeat protein [Planctomycetes bacterium]|nr:tetratricopeptide repeat protein [Planctomycetota bacterium]
MAKGKSPNNPTEDAPPSRRRLYVLLAILAVVASFAGVWWTYRAWPVALPAIPDIDLAETDPEVADAIRTARETLVKSPRSLEAWARLAMVLHAHKFAEPAMTCYAAASALDDDNPVWPYLHAALLHEGPNPEAALPLFEQAARLATRDSPMPRLRHGELLLELGRIEDAQKAFAKALADDKHNVHATFGLAQAALVTQKHQTALDHLAAILHDLQIRKRASALRAAILEQMAKHDDALAERGRFADLPEDPSRADLTDQLSELRVGLSGRLARAKSMIEHSRFGDAISLMEETVKRYPKSDQAWIALGTTREAKGDPAGAEKAIDKSIELAPDRADHRYRLGKLLQSQKRFKEAADAFRRAIERSPADADAYHRLGECLVELGDRPAAADAFRAALRIQPNQTESRGRLDKLLKGK